MRLQFVIGYDADNTIDIDVLRKPTAEESRVIENEIYDIMDLYEEEIRLHLQRGRKIYSSRRKPSCENILYLGRRCSK